MLSPSTIPMTNSDQDVAKLEGLIRKAKSKARIISNLMKDNDSASLKTQPPNKCSSRGQGAETGSKCCSSNKGKEVCEKGAQTAGDSDDLSAPIVYHDGRISQMLRPLEEVIEDFRI